MKTCAFFLFTLCVITNISAQYPPNYKAEILRVLKDKHEYEKSIMLKKTNKANSKTNYVNSLLKIKGDNALLAYLNKAISNNTEDLQNEIVWYNYQNPLSSKIDLKNRITVLEFFKIVKYTIENKNEELPQLAEIAIK